jgi:hypothetical protein
MVKNYRRFRDPLHTMMGKDVAPEMSVISNQFTQLIPQNILLKFLRFMKPQGSLPYAQKTATGPCLEPVPHILAIGQEADGCCRGDKKISWYVNPLLGNDREISNYTTAVTRQRPVNSNRRKMFSVRCRASWLVSD